nr:phosphatidylinositol 4-phosphate 5-kinase its3 [Quercus suber]
MVLDMPGVESPARHSFDPQHQPRHSYSTRSSVEQAAPAVDGLPGAWPQTPTSGLHGSFLEGFGGKNGSVLSVPHNERTSVAKSVAHSTGTRRSSILESEKKSEEITQRPGVAEEGHISLVHGKTNGVFPPPSPRAKPTTNGNAVAPIPMTPTSGLPSVKESNSPAQLTGGLKPPSAIPHHHRASSPPAFSPGATSPAASASTSPPASARPDRLKHRHTLEVPKVNTRSSIEIQPSGIGTDGIVSATGRFSPNTPTRRRASMQLGRRNTRSIHSDMHPDEPMQDEDAARYAEHFKQKRAFKRARADTDDERIVVGTKVDEHHENYVRAYNMLTGIRFCVSRCNAKMDRVLTDADFEAKHKYSFDVTGSELTPSAKYDFKFKDYAPWVFRHLRAAFKLDPAEYLVSLTSKYILSELGSPGKSGSFFYFSRDYKYIIKTIHHGEHKFLRKILRDYHNHVLENPNTLLSQFYGLHRVKLPYGKKVHFVIMNNLFPPHRDIHRTFDLKGSTIGRDFKEEDLEITLKDLNWLRRNLHLEFGPTKKDVFVEQMQRDVALLQRLKIMDYSLLVGIHDLERGNEDNLRDKTLQVFQPGGDKPDEPQMGQLVRTPSKMETAKRARELRENIKKERPVPVAQTLDKMPAEVQKKDFYFYADDGGFQATHEDNVPGEEIYYLGIIDCLTRAEHLWKGFGGHESQISPIPPERYGDRFVRFISGITMSRERAEAEHLSHTLEATAGVIIPPGIEGTVDDPRLGSVNISHNPPGTEKVIDNATIEAEKSRVEGASEADVPDRSLSAVRSPGDNGEAAILPVIGEAAENGSNPSHAPSQAHSHEDFNEKRPIVGDANMPSEVLGEVQPPTPPKADGSLASRERSSEEIWGGRPPPTPPKDEPRSLLDKALPLTPVATRTFSHSPARMVEDEFERARAKVERAV